MKQTTLAQTGGTDPAQDAPGISQMCSQERSQDVTPHLRATPDPEGGSIRDLNVEAIYAPLHYCPKEMVSRYERTAGLAREGSAFQAVKLKCLDCMGWDYPETKRCNTPQCALWLLNRRVFNVTKTKERSAA